MKDSNENGFRHFHSLCPTERRSWGVRMEIRIALQYSCWFSWSSSGKRNSSIPSLSDSQCPAFQESDPGKVTDIIIDFIVFQPDSHDSPLTTQTPILFLKPLNSRSGNPNAGI
jgi:hypothetical protein